MISTGSMFSHIECTSCKKTFSKDEILKLCPVSDCGKVLFPKYDLDINKSRKVQVNKNISKSESLNLRC